MFCPQNIKPNFFPTLKSSHWSWGDLKGPHDPTRATSMKTSLKNRLFYDSVSHVALFLKRREIWLELKRGDCALVQTEMVDKFIALQFPFSSKLKIWSFHVVVVQGLQRNVQISVMHVQSCCFSH